MNDDVAATRIHIFIIGGHKYTYSLKMGSTNCSGAHMAITKDMAATHIFIIGEQS